MYKYFFSYYKDIPKPFRRELFDIQQLIALMIIIIICFLLIYTYRQASVRKKWKVVRVLSFILPIMEVAQMIWYKSIGQFSLGYTLPLHLCSLMCIIMPIMAITKSPLLIEYCYAMGLAPALLALITPDVYFYPAVSFIYIQTIIVHGIICIIPIFTIAAIGFKPNIKNLPKVIAMLIGLAVVIIPVNYFTNGNYFFLRDPAPGSIMEVFAMTFGKPGYLVPTFMVGCIMWVLLYAPFYLKGLKTGKVERKTGNKNATDYKNPAVHYNTQIHLNAKENKNVAGRQKVSELNNTAEHQDASECQNIPEQQKEVEHQSATKHKGVSEHQDQQKETALHLFLI